MFNYFQSIIRYKVHNTVILLVIVSLFTVLPFIVIKDLFDPTQTGKFIGLVIITALLVIVHSTKHFFSKAKYSINVIDFLLILMLLYITINHFLHTKPVVFSLKYYSLICLFALYYVLRTVSDSVFLNLFILTIIVGILQASYGLMQLYDIFPSNHTSFSITGSFFNPGPYSGYLASIFPMALGIYLFRSQLSNANNNKTTSNSILTYISVLGIVTIIFVLPVAESRAAWIAVIISTIFLFWKKGLFLKYTSYLKTKKLYLTWVSIMLLAGVVIITAMYSYKKGSANGRILIWDISKSIILDHPFIGVGFNQFNVFYMEYQAQYLENKANGQLADVVTSAFNEPIQLLVELGIIGAVIALSTWASLMYVVIKSRNALVIISGSSLLSITIFSLFSYPSKIIPIMVIAYLAMAVIAIHSNDNIFSNSLLNKKWTIMPTAFRICMILFLTFGATSIFFINKIYTAYWLWQEGEELYILKDLEVANNSYKAAYPVLADNGVFLQHYGKSLYLAGKTEQALSILNRSLKYYHSDITYQTLGDCQKALKKYKIAEFYYRKAASMVPNKFYPGYLLAKLYYETGQRQKAISMAKTILKKEVKVQSEAVDQIKLEMKHILFMENGTTYQISSKTNIIK